MKLTFCVDLSASFRDGHDCPVSQPITIDIDPAILSPEDRAVIAPRINAAGYVASRDEDGYYSVLTTATHPRGLGAEVTNRARQHNLPETTPPRPVQRWSEWWSEQTRPSLVTATAATVEALIAAIRAEDEAIATLPARKAAAEAAKQEEAIQAGRIELMREPDVSTVAVCVYVHPETMTIRTADYDQPGVMRKVTWERRYIHDWCGATPEQTAALTARTADLDRGNTARRDAAIAAAAEELTTTVIQPSREWADRHGSGDLRRMIAEGMPWGPVYRDERAAWDAALQAGRIVAARPGWTVLDAPSRLQPPLRPRARAWAILDAARQMVPDCRLMRLDGRYVAACEYEGKTLTWPGE